MIKDTPDHHQGVGHGGQCGFFITHMVDVLSQTAVAPSLAPSTANDPQQDPTCNDIPSIAHSPANVTTAASTQLGNADDHLEDPKSPRQFLSFYAQTGIQATPSTDFSVKSSSQHGNVRCVPSTIPASQAACQACLHPARRRVRQGRQPGACRRKGPRSSQSRRQDCGSPRMLQLALWMRLFSVVCGASSPVTSVTVFLPVLPCLVVHGP